MKAVAGTTMLRGNWRHTVANRERRDKLADLVSSSEVSVGPGKGRRPGGACIGREGGEGRGWRGRRR